MIKSTLAIILSGTLFASSILTEIQVDSTSSEDEIFRVSATKEMDRSPGSVGNQGKNNLTPRASKRPVEKTTESATVVSDAGAEAFEAAYSLNCFAPEDREFECINEPDPQNPPDPAEDSPAALSPAEFNAIMATQFAQLHVTGSGLDFQPKGAEGIIGVEFILATNPEPVMHHTELFNIPITIRATPVHYQWEMGDGNTINTTDPGKHYPNQTLTHLYEEPGTYTVSLTTTWAGHFTIENDPTTTWYPVAGTITTTETAEPQTHKKYRTVLIPPDY